MGSEVQIQGYQIESQIAEGDSWLYFRAVQETLQRPVALKVLRPEATKDEELVERFRREARAGARLNHPNIVRMVNQGTSTSGLPFIAFELVEGPSLADLLAKQGRLSEQAVLEACTAVAVALCMAEDKGIVHRDLRPENVVVAAGGVTKLVDLGLAKGQRDNGLTQPGTVKSSPHYVAPEQVNGDAVDTRTDLYALGLVIWHCVTGELPFAGKDFFAVAKRHVEEDVPDPRSVKPDVSEGVAQLIAGLSARDPDSRYRSAAAALLDLQRVLGGKSPLGPEEAGAASNARGSGRPQRQVGRALRSLVASYTPPQEAGPGALLADTRVGQAPKVRRKQPPRPTGFLITVLRDGETVARGHFDQEVVVIGRSVKADMRIDLPIVSRKHAGVGRRPRGFIVSPYSTTNETAVNGKRITAPTPFDVGDEVLLAQELHVIVAPDPAPDETPVVGNPIGPDAKASGSSVRGISAGAPLPSPARDRPAPKRSAEGGPRKGPPSRRPSRPPMRRPTPQSGPPRKPPRTAPPSAPPRSAPEAPAPTEVPRGTGRWAKSGASAAQELGKSSVFVPEKRATGRFERPAAAEIPAGEADRLLQAARAAGAADLHLLPGLPPLHRVHGELVPAGDRALSSEVVEALVRQLTSADQQASFEATGDLDMCYAAGHGRYRTNACRHRTGPCLTCRIVPTQVSSLEELGVPALAGRLTEYAQGLVLITGPLGSGKTTTMMALVELVNRHRFDHIITVEDPIEQVLTPAQCQISQRELGLHTASFEAALRGALREDPDIIVIGDLRDHATAGLAISAAETGHLVFASMPSMSAAKSLDKLVDMFPAGEQATIRTTVSESLRGVLCQRLLPTAEGGGQALAAELLFNTIAVANLIREGKTSGLKNAMQLGKAQGMQTLKMAVDQLAAAGTITPEVAAATLKA